MSKNLLFSKSLIRSLSSLTERLKESVTLDFLEMTECKTP
ncbi:MAG: hypothetical protein CM15mP121_0640 [Bacteroidota bacterium]|nr:MAG: hypothetical protein CM15mP121_0640 [Bacteroidota bacterium]